jgi:3-oxoacyl-[acyl-carrier protein] reductase
MDLGLLDKVAVITGSSRGLGLASARSLVAEGLSRVPLRTRREQLAEAALEVEAAAKRPGMIATVQADVSTAPGIEMVITAPSRSSAASTSSCNNVGRATGTDILGTTDAEWQAAFDETLFPAVRASRLAVPLMKQRGGGSIIMIASIWGREAGGRMTYNAVKAAEISLAKALAQQLAPANIRVNSVARARSCSRRLVAQAPAGRSAGIADMIKRELPFGRFGRADEVGASSPSSPPRASWIAAPRSSSTAARAGRTSDESSRMILQPLPISIPVRRRLAVRAGPRRSCLLRAGSSSRCGSACVQVRRFGEAWRVRSAARRRRDRRADAVPGVHDRARRVDRHRQHRRRRRRRSSRRARRALLDLVLRLRRDGDQVRRSGARADVPRARGTTVRSGRCTTCATG